MNVKKINCDVLNCRYNNGKKQCGLNEIIVSSNSFGACHEADETICTSFKEGE